MKRYLLLLLFSVFCTLLFAQEGYTLFFWNVENFFDTRNDPDKEDDQFTPQGTNRWTRKRFVKKRDGIAGTIIDVTNGELPAFIALAEIENRYVLNQLIYETPLTYGNYRILHKDSPDRRGIDVALLYRKDHFYPLETKYLSVSHDSVQLRDILYTKGVLHRLDTLHLFINHWPSKYGGEKESAPKRGAAADALLYVCDSILLSNSRANVIIAGDFNDTPDSEIMKRFAMFINLSARIPKREGTIKYRGVWELIDQILVSPNMLNADEPVSVDIWSFKIISHSALLERDRNFTGYRPKRTYIGPRYHGGLSDHLPVIVKIYRNW